MMDSLNESEREGQACRVQSRKRRREAQEVPSQVHNTASDPASYPKKRATIACEVCRVRKTRCDSARPTCSFCSSLGIECVYRKTFLPPIGYNPPSKAENTIQDLVSRIRRLENLLEHPSVGTSIEWPVAQQADSNLTQNLSSPSDPPQIPACPSQPPPINAVSPSFIDHWTNTLTSYSTSPNGEAGTVAGLASLSSAYGEASGDGPCHFGVNFHSLGRMAGLPDALSLRPLLQEDGESYIERESYYDHLFNPVASAPLEDDLSRLDTSFRSCWKYQQAFIRNILSWFPIFDEHFCTGLVDKTTKNGLDGTNLNTGLVLFILALGAFTRADEGMTHHLSSTLPGLDYFKAASRILGTESSMAWSITAAQCFILKTSYFLLCTRSLAAFHAINSASTIIVRLLALKVRLREDPVLRESCYRAYWICYVIEHELKNCVHYSTDILLPFHEHIPLPLPNHHEPGFFWLLSEIALRRIFVNGLCGGGHDGYTIYAPLVAKELTAQLEQWYTHLHPILKFPLNTEPLFDSQKAYLRGQYYAALLLVNWSYVVRFLTKPPKRNEPELLAMLEAAENVVNYAVSHFNGVQSLLQERYPMLFLSQSCLLCLSMMVLCIIDIPELVPQHHTPTTVAAIRHARQLLSLWEEADLTVAANLRRLDDLLREKGLEVEVA